MQPMDESQLMIKNLEENTQHLQKAAEESSVKLKSQPTAQKSKPVSAQQKTPARSSRVANKKEAHKPKPLSKPSDQKFGFYANIRKVNSKSTQAPAAKVSPPVAQQVAQNTQRVAPASTKKQPLPT